jgi:hypothetical protein
MAYIDAPTPRWDRIAGFAVWLVVGFVLLEPLGGFLVADCISEECNPSLGLRLAASVFSAFSLSAVVGWTATALFNRVIRRRAG